MKDKIMDFLWERFEDMSYTDGNPENEVDGLFISHENWAEFLLFLDKLSIKVKK